jgi:3-polyprenyl-4-hydroxybenzoate decarboxylase
MTSKPAEWVLARHARIAEHKQTLTVFGRSELRRFDGDSARLARAVLEQLRAPKTRAGLLNALEEEFEGVQQRAPIVDEMLGHLTASGLVVPHVPARVAARPVSGARVVVAATGAVASAFTPMLVSQLLAEGIEVRVALTRAARRFVSTRALEALTHQPVECSLWSGKPSQPAPHIALAEWADLVLVAPASATTLSRLVHGDCSELVAAVAIATRAPVVLAPSMNAGMLEAPAVRRNLDQLQADGFHLVWPSWGLEVAQRPGARTAMLGPMLPSEDLLAIVRALLPVRTPPPRPDASFWDGVYSQNAAEQLPWHTPVVDPDIAAALGQGRGRLLDLGCGLGTVAIAAARLGYQVTASDVSPVALSEAKKAAGSLPIDFVADDVLNSKLEGTFDAVVDRAVLHTLPTASHDRYLRQVTRLMKPGARLVLKVHSHAETRKLGTSCFDVPGLHALLAPDLKIESCNESSLPGALTPAPPALLVVARRV